MSSSSETGSAVEQSFAHAREALTRREAAGDLEEREVQDLFAAAVLLYCDRQEAGHRFPPVAEGQGIIATHGAVAALALIETVGVEIFELGMWKAWGGS